MSKLMTELQEAEQGPPKDVCILIPRPCEHVTSHGKRGFAAGINDECGVGDYSGLPK